MAAQYLIVVDSRYLWLKPHIIMLGSKPVKLVCACVLVCLQM